MIYTTIVSLITFIYMIMHSNFIGFGTILEIFLYGLPFAFAGGAIAYIIKILIINNLMIFGSIGDIIWKTIFWSFLAQVVGAYLGTDAAIAYNFDPKSGFILKSVLWIIAVSIYLFGLKLGRQEE